MIITRLPTNVVAPAPDAPATAAANASTPAEGRTTALAYGTYRHGTGKERVEAASLQEDTDQHEPHGREAATS